MPAWNDVLREIQGHRIENPVDRVRRKYLDELHQYTRRNVVAYYSGWLNRQDLHAAMMINDGDKNAFMTAVHGLDRELGLDLILHTPGGDIAATESLIDYLRRMFGANIRAIVPQLAMSGGTMMACACRAIVMGKQSNLGPIDPQLNGIPAAGVLAEFQKAIEHVKSEPAAIPMWQAIIGRYHPTFLGNCENALSWSRDIACNWLSTGMFLNEEAAEARAKHIVDGLLDTDQTYAHARHLHMERLLELGLKIEPLEEDEALQDLVLTVHHAFMHTFSATNAMKMVENQKGVTVVVRAG